MDREREELKEAKGRGGPRAQVSRSRKERILKRKRVANNVKYGINCQ